MTVGDYIKEYEEAASNYRKQGEIKSNPVGEFAGLLCDGFVEVLKDIKEQANDHRDK